MFQIGSIDRKALQQMTYLPSGDGKPSTVKGKPSDIEIRVRHIGRTNQSSRRQALEPLGSSPQLATNDEANPWIILDLSQLFDIKSIKLWNARDVDLLSSSPVSVDISENGESWSVLATIEFAFGGKQLDEGLEFRFIRPTSCRYVRVRHTGPCGRINLEDIEVNCIVPVQAQLAQDKWVLSMTGGRRGGTFLEIGSSNGVSYNNTFLLEKLFAWRGACVEPNPASFEQLERYRTAHKFCNAAYHKSGLTLEFIPAEEIGTLAEYADSDAHAEGRRNYASANQTVQVETITVDEIIERSNLPDTIDYLSLDTEGSELDILKSIDLDRTKFGLMTIEHNMVEDKREQIYQILTSKGYLRYKAGWDDWYYDTTTLDMLNGDLDVDYASVNTLFSRVFGYGI